MKLQNIEKLVEIKPGFLRASAVFEKNMVLLFQADKDTQLEKHHHPHIQFGYCFNGSFDFNVNGSETIVNKKMSYMIDSDLPHSAIALTNYYSLDLKYITDNNQTKGKVVYNVMKSIEEKEKYSVYKYNIAGKTIMQLDTKATQVQLLLNFIPEKQYCLVAGSTTGIKAAGKNFNIEPMKIYTFTGEPKLEFQIANKEITLFFVEV